MFASRLTIDPSSMAKVQTSIRVESSYLKAVVWRLRALDKVRSRGWQLFLNLGILS